MKYFSHLTKRIVKILRVFFVRLCPIKQDSLSEAGKTLNVLVAVDIYQEKYTQANQDVETCRQQRMQDAENASNTHDNNECHGMESSCTNRSTLMLPDSAICYIHRKPDVVTNTTIHIHRPSVWPGRTLRPPDEASC